MLSLYRNKLANVFACVRSCIGQFIHLLPLILLIVNNGIIKSIRCQFVEIQTELGRIRGFQIQTYFNNPAIAFMGIPYALPPIGNRRFKKPIPHPKWSPKTLIATAYQSCCPQLDINGHSHGDEDCLHLNIFVPLKNVRQDQFSANGKRLPVMIYIQGESFENGDSALYGAEYLLDWDVILVTFNYRVGILGFLSTGDEHSIGNWGLYDQLLVFKWVRDHIESFSGDRNQITIFGQGAGAASAVLHLISPLSNGLFNRVIAQSGSPLCSWSMEYYPQNVALELASRVGCSTKNGNSELVRCLRNTKLINLLKAQQKGKIFGEFPHQFVPVIEEVGKYNERLIPADPKLLISQGIYKRIPLLMGYNQEETAFLYPLIFNRKLFGDSGNLRLYLEEKLLPRFIRATIFEKQLQFNFIRNKNAFKFKNTIKDTERDIMQNILFRYFNFLNSKNYTEMAYRFVNMSTDALYGSCIDETLRLYSTATINDKNRELLPFANMTYKYLFGYRGKNSMLNLILNGNHLTNANVKPTGRFNYNPGDYFYPTNNNEYRNLMNAACHGDELFYLFNLKFTTKKPFDNRDAFVQRNLLHLWTDFAKYGFAPLTANHESPYWPSYTITKPYTYLINDKINTIDSYRESATNFWVRYLPSIGSLSVSAPASIIHKPVANIASTWRPTDSRINHHNDHGNSLERLRTFAWSMLAVSLVLFLFVIILMVLLFYQKRKQTFSAETIPRPDHPAARTFSHVFASRRTSVSGLY